jgi:hypothetical protein
MTSSGASSNPKGETVARPRDTQQSKYYAALESMGSPVLDGAELNAFIARVLRSRFYGSRWRANHAPFDSKPRRIIAVSSQRTSCTLTDVVGKPEWRQWLVLHDHMTTFDALHMLAHEALPDKDLAFHGREMALLTVQLVGRFIDKDTERALRLAFRSHKVKLHAWSEEAKSAASVRMQDRRFKETGDRLRSLVAALEAED